MTLQAFGPDGIPLGSLGSVSGSGFSDGSNEGETAEDRFFGVINPGGILAITISNSGIGGIEVDHLQYGFTCPTDVNGDGVTNVLDLIDLLLCFGLPAVPGCESEDVNTDGSVNVLDLIDLLLEFGNTCP